MPLEARRCVINPLMKKISLKLRQIKNCNGPRSETCGTSKDIRTEIPTEILSIYEARLLIKIIINRMCKLLPISYFRRKVK
jgi:hypothetical protein